MLLKQYFLQKSSIFAPYKKQRSQKLASTFKMYQYILTGVGYGLVLAMTIGPVFFALLRTSIIRGFKSGAFLASGIATSDAFIALIVYSGLSQFTGSPTFQMYAALIGGVLILFYGGKHLLQPVHDRSSTPTFADDKGQKGSYMRLFMQGSVLNLVNPFVYLYWLGLISTMPSVLGTDFTQFQGLIFLSGIIITVFLTDVLKAYIANQLSNILTDNVMAMVDRISGAVLAGLGIYLILYAYFGVALTKIIPSGH